MNSKKIKATVNVDDLPIVRKKYSDKKSCAKVAGITFKLTLIDYIDKLQEAGITIHQVGKEKGKYHLARKCSKTGKVDGNLSYSVSTCRFIPQQDNLRERNNDYMLTEEYRSNMSKVHKDMTKTSKWKRNHKKAISAARDVLKSSRYVNNGVINKRIPAGKKTPKGFVKGFLKIDN